MRIGYATNQRPCILCLSKKKKAPDANERQCFSVRRVGMCAYLFLFASECFFSISLFLYFSVGVLWPCIQSQQRRGSGTNKGLLHTHLPEQPMAMIFKDPKVPTKSHLTLTHVPRSAFSDLQMRILSHNNMLLSIYPMFCFFLICW